jgi:hypothetical protein
MRSMILLTHLAIDMAVRLKCSLRLGSVNYEQVIGRLIFSDSVGAVQPESYTEHVTRGPIFDFHPYCKQDPQCQSSKLQSSSFKLQSKSHL